MYPCSTNELYPEFFCCCFFLSVLLFWHTERKKKDKERHFYSIQRKAWSQIKWNALCHLSVWDFLVSVNNHKSAGTSHSYKHTPLSTLHIILDVQRSRFNVWDGSGCMWWVRKSILPPKMITTRIIHIIPSWFKATNACFIPLHLFGVLFCLLSSHIYKNLITHPWVMEAIQWEDNLLPIFSVTRPEICFSSAHFLCLSPSSVKWLSNLFWFLTSYLKGI